MSDKHFELDRFFRRIERAYRFMLGREAFCGFMLWAGSAVAAAAVLAYILHWGPVPPAVLTGIAAAGGLVYAGGRMRNCRPYEAALYCDIALGGRDRFPALRELLAAGRASWARGVLADECSKLIDQSGPVHFPVCRGPGRYCLLPFLVVILCLGLPAVGPQAETPGPLPAGPPEMNGFMPLIPSGQAIPGTAAEGSSSAEIDAFMRADAFRGLVRELLAQRHDPQAFEEAVNRAADLIRRGDLTELGALIDFIEKAAGGGGRGSGAGLTDAVRAAMVDDDLERIAAEFRLFMERLAVHDDRVEIVLAMRGPVRKYEQARGGEPSGPGPSRPNETIRPGSAQAWDSLPVKYRMTLRRYFTPSD